MNFNVESIEQDLRHVWQQLVEINGTMRPQTVTKTCVANLIVYTPYIPATEEINSITNEIILQHPSRIIFLCKGTTAHPEKINAWGSVNCRLVTGSHQQICCEQIVITAANAVISQVPDLIEQLFINGLPVILYWRDNLTANRELFDRLRRCTDHLIFNSRIVNSAHDLNTVYNLFFTSPNTIVSDISWGRLTPWRQALAGIYDIPAYQPYLERISQIKIIDGTTPYPTPSGYAQSLLLTGWLASRLGWQPITGTTFPRQTASWQFIHNEQIINLTTSPSESVDGIQAIELAAESNPPATFKITLTPDTGHLRTAVMLSNRQLAPKITKIMLDNEAQLLSRELSQLEPDRIWGETLQFLHTWETIRL